MQLIRFLCVSLFLGLTFAAVAQPPQDTAPATNASAATNVPTGGTAPPKTRVLSMEDCIQTALQHNFDIQIQRYNPIVSQYNLNIAYGGYEPTLNVSATKNYTSSPGGINSITGLPFASTERESENFNASILGSLPTGLTYTLNGPLSKNSQSAGTNNIPIPTTWTAGPGITLRQPLLRNFWIDSTRMQIQIDKANLRVSELALQQQVMNTVNAVKAAYYNLIFSRENVEVNRTALKLAQQLAAENKTKVQIGTLAQLDERQAESQAQSSLAALLASEHALLGQENTLKSLLTDNYVELWDVALVPTEQLVAVPQALNLQESWRRAMTLRPDLNSEKLQVEKQNITLRYTYNQRFPQLDLTGSYGRNAFNPSLDTTLDNIGSEKDPFYSYGVAISIPLGNTVPRNNHKASKATLQQLLLQLKQLEQNILVTVNNDVGQVQSTLQQTQATHAARLYAEQALEAEQKKLENGKSTSFQVLQLISNLTSARSAEIRALADYNIAISQLSLDEGGTLEDNRIDFKVK